jgi:hypothetical protein
MEKVKHLNDDIKTIRKAIEIYISTSGHTEKKASIISLMEQQCFEIEDKIMRLNQITMDL